MKNKAILVLTTLFLVSGCTTIDPAAFRGNKHYAVVSTFTDRIKVPDERVMMLDRKHFIAALNSSDMVDGLTGRFLVGFARTAPVKVTFGRSVTNNPVYRHADLPRTYDFMGQQFVAPRGYKIHFSPNNAKIMPIIKSLPTDGGMIIYHNPAVFPSESIAYLSSVLVAYDRSGKKVLQYSNSYKFSIKKYVRRSGGDFSVNITGIKRAFLYYSLRAGEELGKKLKGMLSH